MKKLVPILALLAVAIAACRTPTTYTVDVEGWKLTNVIAIFPNHQHAPTCTLIRFVSDGVTNEFHAWAVPITVVTNRGHK